MTGRICEAHEADPIEPPEPRVRIGEVLMWLASLALMFGALSMPYWINYWTPK